MIVLGMVVAIFLAGLMEYLSGLPEYLRLRRSAEALGTDWRPEPFGFMRVSKGLMLISAILIVVLILSLVL